MAAGVEMEDQRPRGTSVTGVREGEKGRGVLLLYCNNFGIEQCHTVTPLRGPICLCSKKAAVLQTSCQTSARKMTERTSAMKLPTDTAGQFSRNGERKGR